MAFCIRSLYRIRCNAKGYVTIFHASQNSSNIYQYPNSFKTVVCSYSSTKGITSPQTFINSESDQISNLRGQEVEFEQSRAQDVFQNAVEEISHNPETTADFKEIQDKDKDDKEHLAAYQCATNVHLNAVMQTMVPDPFTTSEKAPVHLNMPGGTWSRGQKYLSDHQQGSHQTTLKDTDFQIQPKRECHTDGATSQVGLTQRQKLRLIIKDYGSTVLVFHIGMSLCSVGIFYLAVSSGLDVPALLTKIGMSSTNLAVGGSTFVVAYAVHKVFAPVRIAITLSVTPFIVRYLRRVGFLKSPKGNN